MRNSKFIDNDQNKVKLDFLFVGFSKCATDSIDIALRRHECVYLPPNKETQFFNLLQRCENEECYKNISGFLHECYPQMDTNLKIGGVEPTYYRYPDEVAKYFGTDMDIFFCVRNPINALYSYFKMCMRSIYSENDLILFKKYEHVSADMFDEWAFDEEKIKRYRYSDYINRYIEIYGNEKVNVVFFEELLSNSNIILGSIFDKIGLCYMDLDLSLPFENVGSRVLASYDAAKILRILDTHKDIFFQSVSCKTNYLEILRSIREILTIDYNEPMHESTRKRLKEYYYGSVKELERITGKQLEKLWDYAGISGE